MANSLTIAGLNAGYGLVRAIEDVSVSVSHAETVALLGTNGNGKSTLMKCIMGMLRPSSGTITAEIDGARYELVGRSTEEIVDLSIALVPRAAALFPKLSVEETCSSAPIARRRGLRSARNLDSAYQTFPCCRSAGASSPAACRTASSRCWHWAAR